MEQDKKVKESAIKEDSRIRVPNFNLVGPLKHTGKIKTIRGTRCLVIHDSNDNDHTDSERWRWWKLDEIEKA